MSAASRCCLWEHLGEFVLAAMLGRQLISIDASRATGDPPFMMSAGKPDRGMPRPIVGHWALDGKYAAVEIGDDEEERVSMPAIAYSIARA